MGNCQQCTNTTTTNLHATKECPSRHSNRVLCFATVIALLRYLVVYPCCYLMYNSRVYLKLHKFTKDALLCSDITSLKFARRLYHFYHPEAETKLQRKIKFAENLHN